MNFKDQNFFEFIITLFVIGAIATLYMFAFLSSDREVRIEKALSQLCKAQHVKCELKKYEEDK